MLGSVACASSPVLQGHTTVLPFRTASERLAFFSTLAPGCRNRRQDRQVQDVVSKSHIFELLCCHHLKDFHSRAHLVSEEVLEQSQTLIPEEAIEPFLVLLGERGLIILYCFKENW